MSIEPKIWTKS